MLARPGRWPVTALVMSLRAGTDDRRHGPFPNAQAVAMLVWYARSGWRRFRVERQRRQGNAGPGPNGLDHWETRPRDWPPRVISARRVLCGHFVQTRGAHEDDWEQDQDEASGFYQDCGRWRGGGDACRSAALACAGHARAAVRAAGEPVQHGCGRRHAIRGAQRRADGLGHALRHQLEARADSRRCARGTRSRPTSRPGRSSSAPA